MNEATYSSIFNELTKEVQIRIDTASEWKTRSNRPSKDGSN